MSLTSWKMRFFRSVESSNDRKIALYRVFLVFLSSTTGLLLQFPSKVVILSHFFTDFLPFLERKRQLWSIFFFKTPQILKPGVGPAIHIFLQVKIIFEDSIILMFTLWFWDQRNLSNVMISPVSHISVRIVPETVSVFLAVRIGVFSPFFQTTKLSRGHVCLTCWFPPNCCRVSFGAECLMENNLKNVSSLSQTQQDDVCSFLPFSLVSLTGKSLIVLFAPEFC